VLSIRHSEDGSLSLSDYAFVISLGTLFVSMIGTTSTILLGWRADRRQSDEFKLKIEQLELQLREARKSNVSSLDQGLIQ
jgi:hypothetical protein